MTCAICQERTPVETATWFDVDVIEPYYTAACDTCVDRHYRASPSRRVDENQPDLLEFLAELAGNDDPEVAAQAAVFLTSVGANDVQVDDAGYGLGRSARLRAVCSTPSRTPS